VFYICDCGVKIWQFYKSDFLVNIYLGSIYKDNFLKEKKKKKQLRLVDKINTPQKQKIPFKNSIEDETKVKPPKFRKTNLSLILIFFFRFLKKFPVGIIFFYQI
jgi:hypothetical protein